MIGIALHTEWFEPNTNSEEDKEAAERKLNFDVSSIYVFYF